MREAVFGLFFDSLLGATLERRGWLNNDAVNFLSTAGAAALRAGADGGVAASMSGMASPISAIAAKTMTLVSHLA